MFATPLAVRAGEVVTRDGFVFADVLQDEIYSHCGSNVRQCDDAHRIADSVSY